MTDKPQIKTFIPTQPVWFEQGVWLVKHASENDEGDYMITDGVNEILVPGENLSAVREVGEGSGEHCENLHLWLKFSAHVPSQDVRSLVEDLFKWAVRNGNLVHEMWDQHVATMGVRPVEVSVRTDNPARELSALKSRIAEERDKIINFEATMRAEQVRKLLNDLLK